MANEAGLGDVSLLNQLYKENENIQPSSQYELVKQQRKTSASSHQEQVEERPYEDDIEHITKILEYGAKVALRDGFLSDHFQPFLSGVHLQIIHALKLTKSSSQLDRLLCFIRQIEGEKNHFEKYQLKTANYQSDD